jgi:hypothetical protein
VQPADPVPSAAGLGSEAEIATGGELPLPHAAEPLGSRAGGALPDEASERILHWPDPLGSAAEIRPVSLELAARLGNVAGER